MILGLTIIGTNFTIADIEILTDLRIERNKRNGRTQADHVKLMNFVRDEINHNINWRDGNGRPNKDRIVYEWRRSHPKGKKIECHRDTGLSRVTIDKWWDNYEYWSAEQSIMDEVMGYRMYSSEQISKMKDDAAMSTDDKQGD